MADSITMRMGSENYTVTFPNKSKAGWYESANGLAITAYVGSGESTNTSITGYLYEYELDNPTSNAYWVRVKSPSGTTSSLLKVNSDTTRSFSPTWTLAWSRTHSSQTNVDKPWYVYWYNDSAGKFLDRTWTIHIYGNLDAKPSYSVKYYANGGSSTPTAQTKWYNEPLTLASGINRADSSAGTWTVNLKKNDGTTNNWSTPTVSRTYKYTFYRWNTNSSGTGTDYQAGSSYIGNTGLNLYAKFNNTIQTGSTVLPTPTLANFNFVKWNTNASNTGTGYNAGASYTPGSNGATLHAIWNHTVTFNANGGTGGPSSKTDLRTNAISLGASVPTLNGYTFKRWNTNTSDSGDGYNANASYPAGSPNVVLYAIWNRTLTFDANQGISGSTTSLTSLKTSAMTIPSTATPTRTGYTFEGWGETASAADAAYQPNGIYPADKPNATLYAMWKPTVSIGSVLAVRCNSQGVDDDEGTYARVTFPWDIHNDGSNSATATIKVDGVTAASVSLSGYSGTRSVVVSPSGSAVFELEEEYAITVTVTDTLGGSASSGDVLARAYYTMDILGDAYYYQVTTDTSYQSSKTYYVLNGGTYEKFTGSSFASGTTYYEATGPRPGHGVAFGTPARDEHFTVNMDIYTVNPSGTQGLLFDLIYPVGSIYMSVNSANPGTLFGGSWERITGKFLLAATDNGSTGTDVQSTASVAAGGSGGEASHSLSSGESGVPAHSHGMAHVHSTNIGHGHGHSIGVNQHAATACTRTANVVVAAHGITQPAFAMGMVKTAATGSAQWHACAWGDKTGSYTANRSTDVALTNNHSVTTQPTFNTPVLSHTVTGSVTDYSGSKVSGGSRNTANTADRNSTDNNTAANAANAHNNMPPFLSVYVWKRVS